MPPLLPAALLGLLAVALATGVAIVCARRRRGRAAGTLPAVPARVAGGGDPPVNPVRTRVAVAAFEAAREARTELHRLTFPDADFARPVSGLHAEVIRLAEAALEGAVQQRNYFPRRPLLIPELLAAINDPASSQARWAEIVLRDPVLAGEVLRLANSAWFRVTTDPVEDMPKAVRLLGADGLRSVVASSVLQPVFRCPAGPFQSFPEITWHQAMLSGVGAQYLARHTGDADPAVGHLLGLVVSGAHRGLPSGARHLSFAGHGGAPRRGARAAARLPCRSCRAAGGLDLGSVARVRRGDRRAERGAALVAWFRAWPGACLRASRRYPRHARTARASARRDRDGDPA
ncbi:MAG: HDOD domain-containing protein [Gammaproteobacteria bacterium]|nr:HDOD domain-containing protein [Gammaproteobacteria bacterium]